MRYLGKFANIYPHGTHTPARRKRMTYLVPDSTIALIEARADEARENRVMSHEVIEELKKCGFFKMFLPKQWGGLEARPQEFFREQIRIAEADMSHAWASGIIAIHAYQIAMMDHEAQKTVYGEDPNTLVSSSYNPVGAKSRKWMEAAWFLAAGAGVRALSTAPGHCWAVSSRVKAIAPF
jgi:hypothetical protein